jgi:hypothetical protein
MKCSPESDQVPGLGFEPNRFYELERFGWNIGARGRDMMFKDHRRTATAGFEELS